MEDANAIEIWELISEIIDLEYKCFDCDRHVSIDFWLSKNKCSLLCQDCALIHLTLGTHCSDIKYFSYPSLFEFTDRYHNQFNWSYLELQLLKYCLQNPSLKNIWYKEYTHKNYNKTRFRHSLQIPEPFLEDKSTQINLGSLSTLSQKSLSYENIIRNGFSDDLTGEALEFINNPIFKSSQVNEIEIDMHELIRVKYMLLAFFDYQAIPISCDIDPNERLSILNKTLIENLKTSCLKTTLACLTLGADPNVIVKHKSQFLTALDQALKYSQPLQAYLLIVWGSRNIINHSLLYRKYPYIYELLTFSITDKISQFVSYVSFDESPLSLQDDICREMLVNIDQTLTSKLVKVIENATYKNDLSILAQEVLSEITRRESNFIVSQCIEGGCDSGPFLYQLPINPCLSSARNKFRARLCKISEHHLKHICLSLIISITKRYHVYHDRYKSDKSVYAYLNNHTLAMNIKVNGPTFKDDKEEGHELALNFKSFETRILKMETVFEEYMKSNDIKTNKLGRIITRLLLTFKNIPSGGTCLINKDHQPQILKNCDICLRGNQQDTITIDVDPNEQSLEGGITSTKICIVNSLSKQLKNLYEVTIEPGILYSEYIKMVEDFDALIDHYLKFHHTNHQPVTLAKFEKVKECSASLLSHLSGCNLSALFNLNENVQIVVFNEFRNIAQLLKDMYL